jgi:hypothetical protein
LTSVSIVIQKIEQNNRKNKSSIIIYFDFLSFEEFNLFELIIKKGGKQ